MGGISTTRPSPLLDLVRGLHRDAVNEHASFVHQLLDASAAHLGKLRGEKAIEALAGMSSARDDEFDSSRTSSCQLVRDSVMRCGHSHNCRRDQLGSSLPATQLYCAGRGGSDCPRHRRHRR